eukprot:scaffold8_cov167-Amphora_coffeaeformis.AAC.5
MGSSLLHSSFCGRAVVSKSIKEGVTRPSVKRIKRHFPRGERRVSRRSSSLQFAVLITKRNREHSWGHSSKSCQKFPEVKNIDITPLPVKNRIRQFCNLHYIGPEAGHRENDYENRFDWNSARSIYAPCSSCPTPRVTKRMFLTSPKTTTIQYYDTLLPHLGNVLGVEHLHHKGRRLIWLWEWSFKKEMHE